MLYFVIIVFIIAAILLAWFLLANDRGEKEPIAALWLAAGFGVAGAFMAATIEGAVIPHGHLQPGNPLAVAFGAAMMVGLIEEACKFIPLAIFIFKRRYFNEHTDGVIYFALAGLGFGLPENILYTMQFGAKTGMTRLILTPLFHAAITGMVGYYLARRKLLGKSAMGVAIPLVAAMILHGLYDFGLLSGVPVLTIMSFLITMGLSAALFILYMKATERDQALGLSAVGHNAYCRACGWPNPEGNLYCVRCGKNA
jgi:protease PrsW